MTLLDSPCYLWFKAILLVPSQPGSVRDRAEGVVLPKGPRVETIY